MLKLSGARRAWAFIDAVIPESIRASTNAAARAFTQPKANGSAASLRSLRINLCSRNISPGLLLHASPAVTLRNGLKTETRVYQAYTP